MIVKIYPEVKDKILKSVGRYEPESGGVVACDWNGTLVDFYFDSNAGSGKESYIPSQNAINQQVNGEWRNLGYRFAGIVHSHPHDSSNKPSIPDIKMAEKIIHYNHLEGMFLIIVQNEILSVWYIVLGTQPELCELEMKI